MPRSIRSLYASFNSLSQGPDKSLLFKVMVSGESFMDTVPPHEYETHRVAQGVALIRTLTEEFECLLMKAMIYPDNFEPRMLKKPRRKAQSWLPRHFPDLRQSHEFGEDITMREMMSLTLEQPLRLAVLWLILGMIAE
jgi:hypothetical protein